VSRFVADCFVIPYHESVSVLFAEHPPLGVDTTRLTHSLKREFGGSEAELRVVSRQVSDLVDSGQAVSDRGQELTVEEVVGHLQDAPDDADLVERWNWWMGALDVAYGGYERFSVRFVRDEPGVNT